jgi:hypothetical protein
VEEHGVDLLSKSVLNTEAHPLSIFGSERFNQLKEAMQQRRQN